jgi:preprotein translocase subunit SecG
MLRIVLTFLQFFCALVIIGLVLIQRGKGADAGAGFGAGASGSVFGARGAGTALSRATAILAALFMLNSLALGYAVSHQPSRPKTILDTAGETPSAPAVPALPVVPGRAPAQNALTPGSPPSGASPNAPAPSAPAPTSVPGSVPAPANAPAQTPSAPGRK